MSNISRFITFDNLLREELTRIIIPFLPYYIMNWGSGWLDSINTCVSGEFKTNNSSSFQERLI